MKKLTALLTLLLMFSVVNPVYAIDNSEFSANEAYYRELCTNTLTSEDRGTCTQFQEYLNEKIEGTKNSIEELNTSISEVKDDLAKAGELLQQQQIEIQAAQEEMAFLEESIVTIQANIEKLKEQISIRTKDIEKVNQQIKSQLVAQQQRLHVNSVINFLFGGRSYTEMMRRAHAVNQIGKKDKERMDWFIEEKKKLQDDEIELNRQEDVLEVSLENVTQIKATLEVAKAENEKTIEHYKEQVAQLEEKQAQLQAQASISNEQLTTIQNQFSDLNAREEALRQEAARLEAEAAEQRRLAQEAADEEARRLAEEKANELQNEANETNQEADEVANSSPVNGSISGSNWLLPVTGAMITAGAWYYPASFGGGVHYGMDFGAPVGTPVYSTGPGVVVRSQGGCPTYGYLGNPCGGYAGNMVTTIVSINNKVYALSYMHLAGINVGVNDIISEGSMIGTVGSSGNSSGPHLHFEIFYLGDMTLGEYLSSWNGSFSFTPNGQYMNLGWTCEATGNVAPCRINPQTWYGLNVGSWY